MDFMKVLRECQIRGHKVSVYTTEWQGEIVENISLHLILTPNRSDHRRMKYFAGYLRKTLLEQKYDVIVGFNKLPKMDFYYCNDGCYSESLSKKGFLTYLFRWWSLRFRIYLNLERELFSRSSSTRIFYLADKQKSDFIKHYETQSERFIQIPPSVKRNSLIEEQRLAIRHQVRQELKIKKKDLCLLVVAVNFYLKGLDRVLKAVKELDRPEIKILAIGRDKHHHYRNYITYLGLQEKARFLGLKEDVWRYMIASDILVHPVRYDTSAKTVIEAMVAGLPMIITENVGYLDHLRNSNAGIILGTPYKQADLEQAIMRLADQEKRDQFRKHSLEYSHKSDWYETPNKVVRNLEEYVKNAEKNNKS